MEDKQPAFKRTENKKDIIKIINQRFLKKPLIVQLPSLEDKYGEIIKATDEGVVVLFKNFIPPNHAITLSGFIENFYSEIELNIEYTIQESIFLCKTNYLRISSQRRTEPRFSVKGSNEIYLKRIKIKKSDLSINQSSIPKSYVDLLASFETEYKQLADSVKFSPIGSTSKLHQYIYDTGKTFFMPNIYNEESFIFDENRNKDLIDLKEFYGESLEKEKKYMVSRKIVGRIVLPILGPQADNLWVPIGYIDIISKEPVNFDLLMKVKSISLEIVDKFQEMNVAVFNDRVKLLDISKNGMCLLVKNEELKDAITSSSQFSCYIMIKGQAPINVNCWIRMRKNLNDGSLKVGVKLQGEPSRHDQMIRYWNYIDDLLTKN